MWLQEAVDGGAHVLTGGSRHGAALQPTVVERLTPSMKLVCNEVFGPVVTLIPYEDPRTVFDQVNAGEYGLHFGIITNQMDLAFDAIRRMRVGGVIVNGTTTWRVDQMPYGGVKASGIGREGPRYAIREMCDERLVVFNL